MTHADPSGERPSYDGYERIRPGCDPLLSRTVSSIPPGDKIMILGDSIARVGRSAIAWENILGQHGVGTVNSNGTLLLSFCAAYRLVITNTLFQQKTSRKTIWMHPRSNHWHLLDYTIVRQRDRRDVHLTRAISHTTTWSDHRLVKVKTELQIPPKVRKKSTRAPRLDVSKLKSGELRSLMCQETSSELQARSIEVNAASGDIEAEWKVLQAATRKGAETVLGKRRRDRNDWFDHHDVTIYPILDELHKSS